MGSHFLDSYQMIRYRDFVIIGCKTNGIDQGAEVIELAITNQDGKVLLNTLVKPAQPLHSGVHYPHAIQDTMLATAPSLPEIYPDFLAVIEQQLCACWHAEFVIRLLMQSCDRHQLSIPDKFGTEGFFCTLTDYQLWQSRDAEVPYTKYIALREAARTENALQVQQPSALADCMIQRLVINCVQQRAEVMALNR